MKGGYFQVANLADFSDAVVIDSIKEEPPLYFHEIKNNNSKKYRYYRYMSPPESYCSIAELEFYDENREIIKGNIIGTSYPKWGQDAFSSSKAFDGDILSRFEADQADYAWIGMDFGIPVYIPIIRYMPRTDDNTVFPGLEYELLYWGENKWLSLGRQTADGVFLHYDDAPANALFLLRNHSRGQEERPFTYENGEQVWW